MAEEVDQLFAHGILDLSPTFWRYQAGSFSSDPASFLGPKGSASDLALGSAACGLDSPFAWRHYWRRRGRASENAGANPTITSRRLPLALIFSPERATPTKPRPTAWVRRTALMHAASPERAKYLLGVFRPFRASSFSVHPGSQGDALDYDI